MIVHEPVDAVFGDSFQVFGAFGELGAFFRAFAGSVDSAFSVWVLGCVVFANVEAVKLVAPDVTAGSTVVAFAYSGCLHVFALLKPYLWRISSAERSFLGFSGSLLANTFARTAEMGQTDFSMNGEDSMNG